MKSDIDSASLLMLQVSVKDDRLPLRRLQLTMRSVQIVRTKGVGLSMLIGKSVLYFILAGFCEIGGGYLVWLWLREGKSIWLAVIGALVLILYGVIPTLQPANFGRVYAAYGGIFIALAILWLADR